VNQEQWSRVKDLFAAALEQAPEQRSVFLTQACGENKAVLEEVESLLSAHAAPEGLLASIEQATVDSLVGRRVGPYQIVREIGRGGMATVYLASRADDEFRKRVAIKLLAHGLIADELVLRFRNERQTLAALEHPNIVRLLDGGTTEDGLPYLVMDYVEGIAIDEYCDSRKLSTSERLTLFRTICGAVQYAHQNLIVHRDLKPANILVTSEGVPKLLDFGIAKLLNPELSTQMLLTRANMRAMTPEYASPEQVRGNPVTTATDVYSLGVLLYELLTGHRPYHLKRYTPAELEHAICEVEPEKPSTAATRSEQVVDLDGTTQTVLSPEEVSRVREGIPEKLRRRLSGDLDNIVLMALRKEPQRRYRSVEQFSEDIRKHLEGLPVGARQPTITYRASKFVRRHKAGVASATLLVITLIGGVVSTTREARVARTEKARAERRFNDVHQLANSFLFQFHDAIKDLPGSTPARKLVVEKARQYLDSLAKEAGNDASLQRDLVQAYLKVGDVQGQPYGPNLGDIAGALDSYRNARTIAESLVRSNTADTDGLRGLGRSHQREGQILVQMGKPAEAADHLRRAISTYESLPSGDVKDRLALGACYDTLGDIMGHGSFLNLGDQAAALENFRKALTISSTVADADSGNVQARHDVAVEHAKIGDNLLAMGDTKGAIESHRKAVAAFEGISAADPTNAVRRRELSVVYGKLAETLWEAGQRQEALRLYKKAMGIAQELSQADPTNMLFLFDVAAGYHELADMLMQSHNLPAAIENYRRAVDTIEKVAAADAHNLQRQSELSDGLVTLGTTLVQAGRKTEARRYTERGLALERRLAEMPETSPVEVKRYASALLSCEPKELQDPAQALRFARRADAMTRSSDPEILDLLAQAYYRSGNRTEAIAIEERALALFAPSENKEHASGNRKQFEQNLALFKSRRPPH
jgi:eukaryotic-like serine/threonine-protein kinase